MNVLGRLDATARARAHPADQPRWTRPMLATLVHEAFDDEAWIFERKLDGERCLAFKQDGEVRLRSRNRQDLGCAYPEIVDALVARRADGFIIDGEVVAFAGNRTSFSRLQERMQKQEPAAARATGVAVFYYVFDVLHAAGHDLTGVPLRGRKAVLRDLLDWRDPLRLTPHRNAHGQALLADACRRGWEGLVAKDGASPYAHSRSRSWRKLRCSNQQELVIGGYTDPRGSRVGFGALLVGFFRSGELRYAGKVGTGFDDETLERLHRRLAARARKTTPFTAGEPPSSGVHWVRPDLVAEVAFTEWTDDDRLRHPRYLGLRRDKEARTVGKEVPR
jgi:DNA ligase D-like protein (predicted ligase)